MSLPLIQNTVTLLIDIAIRWVLGVKENQNQQSFDKVEFLVQKHNRKAIYLLVQGLESIDVSS